MPQRPLFLLKNPPLNLVYRQLILSTFALFMVLSNFIRLIPLPYFPSYLSFLELFFYVLAFPLYICRFRKSFFLIIAIFLSHLYGTLLHGFSPSSFLYTCKLAGMIGAGVVVGETLEKKETLVRIFTWILFLGTLIFFFFPRAHTFFAMLEGMGVRFLGDPHERRFISTFFDPNYYAAIATIPLMLTWKMREKKGYFFLSVLFFISILLSFSRSGIATALFTLFVGVLYEIPFKRFKPLRLLAPLLLLIFPFMFPDEMSYFFDRTLHILEDPSAFNRLATFRFGFKVFIDTPLWGIGYNFLVNFIHSEGHFFGIDSSFLTILITFGLIPTLGFALYGLLWSFKKWKTFSPFAQWLYINLLICILFTSQFNNLIFYPFWLIPMIALFVHENRTRP